MTNEEIIEEEMESMRLGIVDFYRSTGMKASGQFEEETVVRIEGKKAFVDSPSYALQLIKGRKPGTMPPISKIESWIRSRGIKPVLDKISISSLAFLIARKIKLEGTQYFQQGGTDLLDSVVTPERIQRILDRLSEYNLTEFTKRISRTLKEAA